jgi:hypothetical protein
MPRLISFDIGIKNLAYCIFDFSFCKSDSTSNPERELQNKCEIVDWDVLDISKKERTPISENTIFCSCFLPEKSKKKVVNKNCKKKAKYEKNGYYYCDTHAKTSGFLLPSKQFSPTSLKKLSLVKLLELEQKYFPENVSPEKKETKIEKTERIYKLLQEKSISFLPIPVVNKSVDLITIGRNLSNQLLNLKHLDNIDYVLIENQISPIANKMKTIQGMVAQLFIMRNVPTIEFVSSSNKLKGFVSSIVEDSEGEDEEEKGKEEKEEEKEKTKIKNPNYKQHKKDGIHYCEQWLNNVFFCKWKSFFDNYTKKQDDLADSFLQGIWYLQKINAVNININNVH